MKSTQDDVVKGGYLDGPFSCILQMPTGSGKTWLAEQAIRKTVELGGRAIYVTPLRALASEVAARWSASFPRISVGVFTGDYSQRGKPFPVPFEKARVLVMTPERLDACTRSWRSHWSWIPDVDLLVVDEIHLLGEPRRGARLEGALCRFRRLNPFARMVGLSATLGNCGEIADWLEGVSYCSHDRPIPLEWRIVRFRKPSDKPALVAGEVKRNVDQQGKSLVFVQSRRRAEELGHFLESQGLRARHHHAGLDHDQRKEIEVSFRSGDIDVLVATSTLEMGLNLPVCQVILYDLQMFDGQDFTPLSTNSVWQRIGRAGRPGLDDHGEAVLLAANWDKTAENYRKGCFEPIRSRLPHPAALAEQIVTEVASGSSMTRSQLGRAFCQTLASKQGLLKDTDKSISTMCEAGLLLEWRDPDKVDAHFVLKATRAGRIVVRHMLMPQTILGFQKAFQAYAEMTFLDILLITTSSEDCEPILNVDFEELDVLAASLADEPSHLIGQGWAALCETLSVTPRRLLSSLKMALILRRWTLKGDLTKVAEDSDCYPFEITRLKESVGRLLQAIYEFQSVKEEKGVGEKELKENLKLPERILALERMVLFGLDESAVTLCFVKGIGGIFARRLVDHGISDIEELASAMPEDLSGIKGLSKKRARQWIEEATSMVKLRHGWSLRDIGSKVLFTDRKWPHGIDPYRLRRSLDLTIECVAQNYFRVSGGLEPHEVNRQADSWACDCIDHQRGNLCKHILAVQRHRREETVTRLVKSLQSDVLSDQLDLIDLWLNSGKQNQRKYS